MGSRRSLPKALGVMRTPGAAWRRLYSLPSIMATTRCTVALSMPVAAISSTLSSMTT